MWEDLYVRRYESRTCDSRPESHAEYRHALEKLYQEVLRFQIVCYGYYSHKSASRLALDAIKHHGWEELIENIKYREAEFDKVSNGWRDKMYNEEWEKEEARHQQAMCQWRSIGTDISELRKAVEKVQEDEKRQKMLDWLCAVDTSVQYRAARGKYSRGTCAWLVQESDCFKAWERTPKSFLWLNGKGSTGANLLIVFRPLTANSWLRKVNSELICYQILQRPLRTGPRNRSCILLLQLWQPGATKGVRHAIIACATVVCESPRHATADQKVRRLYGKRRAARYRKS